MIGSIAWSSKRSSLIGLAEKKSYKIIETKFNPESAFMHYISLPPSADLLTLECRRNGKSFARWRRHV